MKFLIDMNLSPTWTEALGEAGLQAAHWSTIGSPSATDAELMAYALQHGYIVLTHDLDFSAILAANQGLKPSVVQIRAENIDPKVIGRQIIAALRQMEAELDSGALLTIDPSRTRLRLLPLRSRE